MKKLLTCVVILFAVAGVEFLANVDGLARHLLAFVGLS